MGLNRTLNMVRDGVGLYLAASYLISDLQSNLKILPSYGFENDIAVYTGWRSDHQNPALKTVLELLWRWEP
jgi:DNA-binding transcriptional LysR family regulator